MRAAGRTVIITGMGWGAGRYDELLHGNPPPEALAKRLGHVCRLIGYPYTLTPAVTALKAAVDGGAPIQDALQQAATAAEEGMKGTIPLVARKGRASYLGERSAGHQDPGATSSYLLIKTAAETL